MEIIIHKGCFGASVKMGDHTVDLLMDYYLLEDILYRLGEQNHYDDYDCDQCGDWNYKAVYHIDDKYVNSIQQLFVKDIIEINPIRRNIKK